MSLLVSLLALRGRVLNPPHSSVVALARPMLLPRETSCFFPHLTSCKKESFLPARFPDIFWGEKGPKSRSASPCAQCSRLFGDAVVPLRALGVRLEVPGGPWAGCSGCWKPAQGLQRSRLGADSLLRSPAVCSAASWPIEEFQPRVTGVSVGPEQGGKARPAVGLCNELILALLLLSSSSCIRFQRLFSPAVVSGRLC